MGDTWAGQCILDFASDRVLPVRLWRGATGRPDRLANTPQKCQAACAEAGYKYAGVTGRRGRTCRCGNAARWLTEWLQVDSSECSAPCPGDSEQQCGGESRQLVFPTGA